MGFNEKSTLANLGTTLVVWGWYFITTFTGDAPTDTAFSSKMWWTMGIYVALIIAAMVVTAILSRDEGDEMGETDERDVQIEHHAETWSGYVAGCGLFGILFLVMQETSTFMLAHAVLGLMVLQTAVSFGAKFYLYRR